MDDEESDTFKVFIATDNHLGYLEEDTIRGEDSFNTFEEILMLSKEEKADMLLLGGDLFHHNKPSRPTMYRTMNLFRKYCQGGGPINFRIVSDQSRVSQIASLSLAIFNFKIVQRTFQTMASLILKTRISMWNFLYFQSMAIMMILFVMGLRKL